MARGNVRVSIESKFNDRGVRDAQRSLDRLNRVGTGFGKGIAAGAAVGSAGLAALTVEAARSFKAFEESYKIGKQTQAVLKSTGQAAGVTAKQVSALADALSRKTGIDDEAIQSGENLLLTFTNIRNEVGKGNDIFTQATKAATDMSVAMGQDLNSSVLRLGKALNDPVKGMTALQRVGVLFTDQQKEQVKALVESGKGLEAQKLILREINKEFGGSAAAQATPFDRVKVSVENLEEAIGKGLNPLVQRAASGIDAFARKVTPAVEAAGDKINAIFGRNDLGFVEKLSLSAGVVRRALAPTVRNIAGELKRANLGDKLSGLVEAAVPKIADAFAAAAPRAATAFINGFNKAGTWGKLLTVAFLAKKLGAFSVVGRMAANQFADAFSGGVGPALNKKGIGSKGPRWVVFGRLLGRTVGIAAALALAAELEKTVGNWVAPGSGTAGGNNDPNPVHRFFKNLFSGKNPLDAFNTLPGSGIKVGGSSSNTSPRTPIDGFDIAFGRGRNPLYIKALNHNDQLPVVRAGRYLQTLGLDVGESRYFGGVTTNRHKHYANDHYSGNSIDVNYAGGGPKELSRLKAALQKIRARFGDALQNALIEDAGKANQHLHLTFKGAVPKALRNAASFSTGAGGKVKLTKEQKIVVQAARKYGIDPAILWGLYGAESNFGKNAGTSSAGAVGPFQFMPGTARSMGINPMDFRSAAFGAAKYLSQYAGRGTEGMLAAYNAGPKGNPNNPETRAYIPKVLRLAKKFPNVDSVEGISDSELRDISETIVKKYIITPIARSLRKAIGPLAGGIGRADRSLEKFGGLSDIASASGDILGQRDALIGKGFAEAQKKRLLEQAARKYSAAIKKLKAKLKRAPSMQKGAIRAQISRYQDRLRGLRDEARALGIQIQIDTVDLQAIIEDIRNAPTGWSGLAEGYQGFLDAKLMQAGFVADDPNTPDVNENVEAQKSVLMTAQGWYQRNYDAAVKAGDSAGIVDWGQKLKDVADALKNLTESTDNQNDLLEQQNAMLQQQLDLEKQRAEDLRKALNVSQSQYGVFTKWLADTVSGQVGGRVGLGFQSPAYAGGGARY